MFKAILALVLIPFLTIHVTDKVFTKKGKITFFSETSMENIEAINHRVTAVLETNTGKLEFSALITAFEFEKAKMQEHFNEDIESTKFPKSTFKGKIDNISDVNFSNDGSYPVNISGDLTIHGITKAINEKGTIKVTGGKISAESIFWVVLKDYNIKERSKVADKIKVTVSIAHFEPLKK